MWVPKNLPLNFTWIFTISPWPDRSKQESLLDQEATPPYFKIYVPEEEDEGAASESFRERDA